MNLKKDTHAKRTHEFNADVKLLITRSENRRDMGDHGHHSLSMYNAKEGFEVKGRG